MTALSDGGGQSGTGERSGGGLSERSGGGLIERMERCQSE